MSSDEPLWSPEQLQIQKIFDLIWMELREHGGLTTSARLSRAFCAMKSLAA
jgi:hypothetical protein